MSALWIKPPKQLNELHLNAWWQSKYSLHNSTIKSPLVDASHCISGVENFKIRVIQTVKYKLAKWHLLKPSETFRQITWSIDQVKTSRAGKSKTKSILKFFFYLFKINALLKLIWNILKFIWNMDWALEANFHPDVCKGYSLANLFNI